MFSGSFMEKILEAFLKERGVSEESIKKMTENKIDPEVIKEMDDKELEPYIPKHGDRLATIKFCKNKFSRGIFDHNKRKQTLLEKLRRKLKRNTTDEDDDYDPTQGSISMKLRGNLNAKKEKRRIDVGWIMVKDGMSKQVRMKNGGGTRKLIMDRDATDSEILTEAKTLFFPNGRSTKGYESEFDFELWDFAENKIRNRTTINEMYETTKFGIIRVYLASVLKSQDCEFDSLQDFEFQNTTASSSRIYISPTSSDETLECGIDSCSKQNTNFEMTSAFTLSAENMSSYCDFPGSRQMSMTSVHEGNLDSNHGIDLDIQKVLAVASSSETDQGKQSSTIIEKTTSFVSTPINMITDNVAKAGSSTEKVAVKNPFETEEGEPSFSSTNNYDAVTVVPSEDATGFDINHLIHNNSDPEITFSFFRTQESPQSHTLAFEDYTLVIHEDKVLIDMIMYFKDPTLLKDNVLIHMKRKNHLGDKLEVGEGSGMLRDVLTTFWTQFYEQCTVGCNYKVPFTRHDFQETEWQAVARMIVVGWQLCRYFPISIAPTIFEECLYGGVKTDIVETFLLYLPSSEVDVLRDALKDFNSVSSSELMDVVSAHKGRAIPTKDNLQSLCHELAIKELVQDTMYVIDVWKTLLFNHLRRIREADLRNMYQAMIPTCRKVLNLLKFPEHVNNLQADVIMYIKRYIKEMDLDNLKLFLRFCTGADLLVTGIEEIKVEFSNMEGLSRRPIAHTCACMLEISDNYRNFPEFRSEFNSVLKSGFWGMDFV